MPASAPANGELPTRADQERELRRQVEELERKLQLDPLSFENQALELQLEQMKIDYKSLQDDFLSMGDYFSQRISEMTAQLEEQKRAASTASGHAECLSDLFHFHEDQGRLAGSYWRAQCEKRDDSIKFLTLKLQEYTVPWPEYEARRKGPADADAAAEPLSRDAATSPSSQPPPPTTLPARVSSSDATRQDFQLLREYHTKLCKEVAEAEEHGAAIERELEASELDCAALRGARDRWSESAAGPPPTDACDISSLSSQVRLDQEAFAENLEAEAAQLRIEVEACEEALAGARERQLLPSWVHRCPWRDELDVRAGQLERISLQFDATKRLLDAANEELQWQAMSAEALRVRLDQVDRSVDAEEAKAAELQSEHREGLLAMEALLQRWPAPEGGGCWRPPVHQQAEALLQVASQAEKERLLSAA